MLASPSLQHADIQLFVQSNPSLSEFKLKVQETAAGRLFSFQLPRESHTALFQTSQGRVFLIPMPQLTALREARLLGAEAKPAPKVAGKPVIWRVRRPIQRNQRCGAGADEPRRP